MSQSSGRGPTQGPEWKAPGWYVHGVYILALFYNLYPGLRMRDERAPGIILSLFATVLGFYYTYALVRVSRPLLKRLEKRFIEKNAVRLWRDSLCALLIFLPVYSADHVMIGAPDALSHWKIAVGYALVMGGCFTVFGIMWDLARYTWNAAGPGGRPAAAPRADAAEKPFRWTPLAVTTALYGCVLYLFATGSDFRNRASMVCIAAMCAFGFCLYRALNRLARWLDRLDGRVSWLAWAVRAVRLLLCGAVVVLPLVMEEHPGHAFLEDDGVFGNLLKRSLGLGVAFECMISCVAQARKKQKAQEQTRPTAVRQAAKPEAVSQKDWIVQQHERGEALAREVKANQAHAAQAAQATKSAQAAATAHAVKPQPAATSAQAAKPEPAATSAQAAKPDLPKPIQVKAPAGQASWAAVESWRPGDAAKPVQAEGPKPEAAPPVGPPTPAVLTEAVSRGQLSEWLRMASEGLEPRGEALGTLAGQRALFTEAEALMPVLSTLRVFPPLARFLFDGTTGEDELPDRVGALLGGVCQTLEDADLEVAPILWLDLGPEALVRGWRALSAYRRISAAQYIFDETLQLLEAHLMEREDAIDWLRWRCEGVDA